MKVVTYSNSAEFKLTNREFEEAELVWQVNKNYYCLRTEVSLSPRFLYACPPPREGTKKVYLFFWNNTSSRYIFNSKGKAVEILSNDELYFPQEGEAPALEDMVLQEEYYDEQSRLMAERLTSQSLNLKL